MCQIGLRCLDRDGGVFGCVQKSDFKSVGSVFSSKQRLKNDSIDMKRASFSAGLTLHSGCKDGFVGADPREDQVG